MYDPNRPMRPRNIIDKVVFGRDLRALRGRRGFERATEFTAVLRSQYGVQVSDRTLYAVERGELMPRLDFFFAVVCALDAERDYFSPAIRADVTERLAQRRGRE